MTVDAAELAPMLSAPGVPASSEVRPPVVVPELVSAVAVASACTGVTTKGPEPVAEPLAVAVSCWRLG